MDEKTKGAGTVSISDDARWGKAVFACLDKIVELTKETNFTKEMAETTKILAETAAKLEVQSYQESQM